MRESAVFLGYLDGDGFTVEHADLVRGKSVYVVKTHPFNPRMAELASSGDATILYSYRDVRDVVYSFAHKVGITPLETLQHYIPNAIESYYGWTEAEGCFSTRYEDFVVDTKRATGQLAARLGVRLSKSQIDQIDQAYNHAANKERARRKELELRAQGCDLTDVKYSCLHAHEELVHWNHLRSGEVGQWRQLATLEHIRIMGPLCAEWLIKAGYEIDDGWCRLRSEAA